MKKEKNLFGEASLESKPFIKWAGGKGQLEEIIINNLPSQFETMDTYIEPFIGGGAIMFSIINRFPHIKKIIINDINPRLINVYKTIQNSVDSLIEELSILENHYKNAENDEMRTELYIKKRREFNEKTSSEIKDAALFLFLNRTCFNGLYRVNSKGLFNVPCGKYKNPNICNTKLLIEDSLALQKVEILNGDYNQIFKFVTKNSLIYFDPPYRPISSSSSFNSYVENTFNDIEQIKLKEFCDKANKVGGKFMLSNSDPKSKNINDNFFDELYSNYNIQRVEARRNINSKGGDRGAITELLIKNY